MDFKYLFGNRLKNSMKERRILWILVVTVVLLSVLIWQNYTINLYARAALKLAIMQVIDLKNFKNLLYDSCLVYKKIPDRVLTNSDCYSCEIINRVTVVNDPEETLESYAEFDWPVVYKSRIVANVSAEDVARVLLTGDFLPCDYKSNLRIDPLRAIEIKSGWFMHWRNCDDIQGKKMRSLYRPDSFLSIFAETWTIISLKYNTVHYKKIDLNFDSRVAVVQINGTIDYQMVPKNPCSDICRHLDGRLTTYDTLIFNNFIWDFQYLPSNDTTESIAIVFYLDQ
ncbi:uncharacterized protein LOC112692907 [Sipha flava]|uniref:Uncharacterized protein LOC112692907 n=1 Tax=Sipha flava TaxID=143950 RepID=A0A2S2R8X9_9HEMI|nr:uncharacterized protein LOC112692907 [Sipha flava]